MFLLFWFLWTFVYKFLGGHIFISLGSIPRCGIAGSYANSIFNHLRNYQAVFQSGYTFAFSPAAVFYFWHLHRYFVIVCLFDYSHCYRGEWYLILVWICISLMSNNIENLLICLLTIYMYIFFEEMSVQSFCPFHNWVFCLSSIRFAKICFHSVGCHFTFSMASFETQKF